MTPPRPWEKIPGESDFAHSLFVAWLHCGFSEERIAESHRLDVVHVREMRERFGWELRRQAWYLYAGGVAAETIKAQAVELAAARARAISAHAKALEVVSLHLDAWAERARNAPGAEEERYTIQLLRAIPQGLKRLEQPLEQQAQQGNAGDIDPARLTPEEREHLRQLLEKATPPE